jgi:hypothetical protein
MQHSGFYDRIVKLDRNIRFVGVVNEKGEVIQGGFREGVHPLLSGMDEQQMYVHALSNVTTLQQFSDQLGKVKYTIAEHEKIMLLTVPLLDGILCVSASSKADAAKLRDKVLAVIRASARSRKK